jgi:hypothetical protein
LKEINFEESLVPVGLLSVIALNNPALDACTLPIGASDDDLITLTEHCRNLRLLDVSSVTSQGQSLETSFRNEEGNNEITKVGLDSIGKLQKLESLGLPHAVIDRVWLHKLVCNNVHLKSIRIRQPCDATYGERPVAFTTDDDPVFMRWLSPFVQVATDAKKEWEIRTENMREKYLKCGVPL